MGIEIQNCRYCGEPARVMKVNGAIESATYRLPGRRNELIFPYLRELSLSYSFRPWVSNTLLIGGGGFAYPKYYISHYPEKRMDVIEISPEVIAAARKSFYIDETIREQGMDPEEVFRTNRYTRRESSKSPSELIRTTAEPYTITRSINENDFIEQADPRLQIFCEDGFDYLLRSNIRYDLIINDAFNGKEASGTLNSEDGARLIKAHLNKGCLYVINTVTAENGPWAGPGRTLKKIIGRHFRVTGMIPVEEERPKWEKQNFLFFASDEEL